MTTSQRATFERFQPNTVEFIQRRFTAYTEDAFSSSSTSNQVRTSSPPISEPEHMSTISREELDAKLETIEVRMDGRVSAIQGEIRQLITRLDADKALHDARLHHIETAVTQTANSVSGLKSTIVITAVSTVIAIVLGVAAFNATLLSNMVASFESGKNTASAQADVKRQAEETAALLTRIQESVNKTERDQGEAPKPSPKQR